MQIVKFDDIQTPTTVEEFRINLKKYFFTIEIPNKGNFLMVKSSDDECLFEHYNIDKMNSMHDIENSWNSWIAPTMVFDIEKITQEEIMKYAGMRDFTSVFQDQSRTIIYADSSQEDQSNLFEKYQTRTIEDCDVDEEPITSSSISWYKGDNQILRAFWVKTLGEFSLYPGNYFDVYNQEYADAYIEKNSMKSV